MTFNRQIPAGCVQMWKVVKIIFWNKLPLSDRAGSRWSKLSLYVHACVLCECALWSVRLFRAERRQIISDARVFCYFQKRKSRHHRTPSKTCLLLMSHKWCWVICMCLYIICISYSLFICIGAITMMEKKKASHWRGPTNGPHEKNVKVNYLNNVLMKI